ncbi:transposase [Streptomyces sp. NPDC097727]|uniref:transposase n=1 Tax=Streptomyces sp. NPDC097727 TaxID=3366092 RepID=UPI00381191C6
MTDTEWAQICLFLPVPAWLEGRGGRPEGSCQRQITDAVRYLVDNGTKWRSVPADFPARRRVYVFFHRWLECGPSICRSAQQPWPPGATSVATSSSAPSPQRRFP